MKSPYSNMSNRQSWRTGVAEQHPFTVQDLYYRKFNISATAKIATAGSCFAQHIGGHLRNSGYNVMDVEPAPKFMTDETARQYGYRIYSARYGNIYLVAQLLQLAKEAFGIEQPKDTIWQKNGRFYDALRPSVEPSGLNSREEVQAHRTQHLEAVRSMFENMNLFIFTMGLTEGWIHTESKTVFPTAPGTIAGSYNENIYSFKNYRSSEIVSDFLEFREIIKSHNKNVNFLLTVSPVPLTATASVHHVLSATTYSKSVLRGAAGELCEDYDDIDYFPSYEMIASPFSRGFFYSPNLRSVEPQGVLSVMRVFFDQHPKLKSDTTKGKNAKPIGAAEIVCEEVMLEAFLK